MAYGKLLHNELYRKTQEFGYCHTKNFNTNLKHLVEDHLVLRKKSGKQKVEYSINHDFSKSINDAVDWLDYVIKESQTAYDVIKQSGTLLAESKKLDQRHFKKSLSILERGAGIIFLLLEATKWYPLLIKLGNNPKIVVNKLIRMQKVHLETIDKIFDLIPTLDQEVYANLVSLILKKMNANLAVSVSKSS